MSRREWFLASAGLLLLAVSALALRHGRMPAREVVFPQACGIPVRIMDPGVPGNETSAVVLHGLGANAVIMRSLGQSLAGLGLRVYLLDLPGHGNNTDSFSFRRAEECSARLISLLDELGEIRLGKTILIGHSMGGALAIRMADHFPTAATIAISPAPMVRAGRMPTGAILMGPPHRMPVNLLVQMGQFDFPYSQEAAVKLIQMAGGERSQPQDFLQKRALRLDSVPLTTHTSLIFNSASRTSLVEWIRNSTPLTTNTTNLSARPSLRLEFWGVMGLHGLLLGFPLFASAVARAFDLRETQPSRPGLPGSRALFAWLVSGFFAVSLLSLVPQLNVLRMAYGGYLAACVFISGVVLLSLLRARMPEHEFFRSSRSASRGVIVGAFLGFATLLAVSAWMNLQLSDTWLNAPRWLRFFPALLACLPYALAEEWALGAPGAGNALAKLRRLLLFIALRLLIWLSILFALYAYASGQILLSVLVLFMGTFSLLTRLGADAIRRRTGSPGSAAVFTAILMAWFLAAVFPII